MCSVFTKKNTIWIGLTIYLFVLSCYLLTFNLHVVSTPDEFQRLGLVRSLVFDGSLVVEAGRDRPFVTKYPIFQSIAAIPWYLAGYFTAQLLPGLEAHSIAEFSTGLFMPMVCAAIVVIVFKLSIAIGSSVRSSVGAAVVLGLASCLWPYSKRFFSEPVTALLLLVGAWGFLTFQSSLKTRHLILSFGILILAGLNNYLSGLVILMSAAILIIDRERRKYGVLRIILIAGIAFALCVSLCMLINHIKFGHPIRTGYEESTTMIRDIDSRWAEFLANPLFIGLYGFLFSSGRSIFLFNPPLILALLGIGELSCRNRVLARYIAVTSGLFLLFYSKLVVWYANGVFGPRYLIPVIPLLFIPLALWFQSDKLAKRAVRVTSIVIIAAGILVQLLGISFRFGYLRDFWVNNDRSNEYWVLYIPQYSPLIQTWSRYAQNLDDLDLLALAFQRPRNICSEFAPASARFVKISQTGAARILPWSFAELRFFKKTNSETERLMPDKWTIKASCGTENLQALLDDSVSTRWSSAERMKPGMWLLIDFGGTVNDLSAIELDGGDWAFWNARGLTIELSEDGESFFGAENLSVSGLRPKVSLGRYGKAASFFFIICSIVFLTSFRRLTRPSGANPEHGQGDRFKAPRSDD
ncbi:hypothetical protein ACFLU6_03320 [Acidobacteriota bacterium]